MLRVFASILLLVLSLSVVVQAQEPAANKQKLESDTINGRVVSESGSPVPNALVHVRTFNAPNAYTATTDRDGSFQVSGLEPANYYVSATAPAYITPPPDQTKPQSTYRPGDSVTLTLIKGGVITGTVINAAGEPVVWIGVRVQMIRNENGISMPRGYVLEAPTDDRGVYRFYGLRAGTYVVSAGGPGDLSRRSVFINAFDNDAATYAPSSLREDAVEMRVRAGEETAGVDIRYRAEQGRRISGEVRLPPKYEARFIVTLIAAGQGEGRWQTEVYETSGERNFNFNGVRDGDYEIFAQTYTEAGERGATEEKQISVAGANVSGIVLTAKQFGSITGKLLVEEPAASECKDKERPLPHQTSITAWHNENAAAKLTPQSVWSMRRPAQPDAQGNFLLNNLAAGEYSFATRIEPKYWYLRSVVFTPPVVAGAKAASKPVDAMRAWITLKPGDKLSGFTFTLGHGAGLLRGQIAVGEGEAIPPRVVVYLVPAERERAEDVLRFSAANVSPEGWFSFDKIAPGRYWAIAEVRPEGVTLSLSQVRHPHEAAMRSRLRREAEIVKSEIEFKPCQEIGNFKLPLKPAGQ
jgi:hypothetical protein